MPTFMRRRQKKVPDSFYGWLTEGGLTHYAVLQRVLYVTTWSVIFHRSLRLLRHFTQASGLCKTFYYPESPIRHFTLSRKFRTVLYTFPEASSVTLYCAEGLYVTLHCPARLQSVHLPSSVLISCIPVLAECGCSLYTGFFSVMASLSQCVHGQWIGERSQCECDKYWHGIDCNVKKCFNGSLDTTTGECRCSLGYTGDFCEWKMCSHEGKWYCDEQDSTQRELCPDQLFPGNIIGDDWACSCGQGTRIFIGNATHSSCLCEEGYYGEFCEWKLCKNEPCVNSSLSSISEGTGRGLFGLGFSSDLLLALLLTITLLVVCLAVARLCARRIRSRRARREDRMVLDQLRAWRSARKRFMDGEDKFVVQFNAFKSNSPGDERTSTSYNNSLHDVFWWKNTSTDNRPTSFRRLTIVMEENSDVDEESEQQGMKSVDHSC